MKTELDIEVRKSGKVSVLGLSGDLDSYTCSKLRQAIISLINEGDFRVVIDMSGVNYIDSSGLGTLVGGLRRTMEQGGGLALTGAGPQITKVMTITGLIKVLNLFHTESDAVSNLA
ncbi:MAG: STAS domain-containing protein [Armatimonadota bacterium]